MSAHGIGRFSTRSRWPHPIQNRRAEAQHSAAFPSISRAVLLLMATSCGEPLVSLTLVQDNRVLGARVERVDAPEQAWVAPASSARLRWFVTSPDGPPELGWSIALCPAAPIARGLQRCAEPVFARFSSTTPTKQEPSIEFEVPNADALRGATQLNASTAFCSSGNPILNGPTGDVMDAICPKTDESPLLASMALGVVVNDMINLNPSFDAVEFRLDQVPWGPWSEPAVTVTDCTELTDSVPQIRSGTSGHSIELRFQENLSESLPTVSSHSERHETVQLAHFTSGGSLERAFSALDFVSNVAETTVAWDAPPTVTTPAQLVRFSFVLRDGRGGVDWSTRAVCVLP